MVPPPHVFEGRKLDLLDRPPRALLPNQLGLVEIVDRLGHGIVERIPDGPGRRNSAEFLNTIRVHHGRVVRTVVRVMDESVESAA